MGKREDVLRAAVKQVFGRSVTWVEPGRGGTVGAADCWLPIRGVWVGVELKDGERLRDGLSFTIRGSQRLWHRQAAMDAVPSCVLIRDGDDLAGLPGADYPLTQADACFPALARIECGVINRDRKTWEDFVWKTARVSAEPITG